MLKYLLIIAIFLIGLSAASQVMNYLKDYIKEYTDFNSTNSPAKLYLVAELAEQCQKKGNADGSWKTQ